MRKRIGVTAFFVVMVLSLILSATQCSVIDSLKYGELSYFLKGSGEQKKELADLLTQLQESESQRPESRFILLNEIIKQLYQREAQEQLNLLLSTYVEENPQDPYNAYYLLVIAENYRDNKAYPFAVHYYERILKNYSDLLLRESSVHYLCLKSLITLVDDPEVRIQYYKELIARFSGEIDMGEAYYFLGKTYEEVGEWELAIQAYKQFLLYPETSISDRPEAHKDITSMITFYDRRDKDWTTADLDSLVNNIKAAIWREDPRRLRQYMAKVNFFALSWEEEETQANIDFLADIGIFLKGNVSYSRELDEGSNSREAYLRTWGWSYRIKTWYLYFRRVNFPADPEIHGQWEWAGIYFGEKPFAGSSNG
ncbi:hypothetical protein [Marispirochaeta sp.]|uniref:tetratricopeptide repeat protein n=1 Tax=Marispirochaeta sp. TaxID=2038653 RepID=UPI0029C676BC|nr:hypothetical protein [Marispirochaeta sp.]